jgi:hypothetical protein
MKKTKITIKHQLEKSDHHFLVMDPNKLSCEEVEYIKMEMGIQMVFVNGKLYK